MYYNAKSLLNILSLSQIDDKYRVTYDLNMKKAFLVHGTMGTKGLSEVVAVSTIMIHQQVEANSS